MAINRFMVRQPIQPNFYKDPLDILASTLQARQQQFDKYAMLSDKLLSTSINAMDADRARANAITRGYQQSVDKMVEKYGGDYSKMGRELMGLARQVRSDFTSGGEAFAIEYNKGQYDKWLDFSQKSALSGRGPSVQQVNLGNQYALNNYKGAQYNPDTGTFSTFQAPNLVEYQELSDLVDQFAKSVVPEKIASGAWVQDESGVLWEKNKVGIQKVTPERIQQAVMLGLQGHQGWNAYAQQMEQFGAPITPETYAAQVNRAVNTYAYLWKETDQDIQWTPKHIIDGPEQEESPIIGGKYMPSRIGEGALPEKFDKTEAILPGEGPGYQSTPSSTMLHELTGEEGMKVPLLDIDKTGLGRGKGYEVKTFDEYMNREQVVQKYGQFGQNLYKTMKNNPEFKKASESEKRDMFAEAYNTGYTEFRRTNDYVYTLNEKTKENLTNDVFKTGVPAGAKYTVIERGSEKTHTDLNFNDFRQVLGGSYTANWGNTKKGARKGLQNIQEDWRVAGMIGPSTGLDYGLEVTTGDAKIDSKYRIIMHNFDAKAEEVGKRLKMLYEPYKGGAGESDWIPVSNAVGPFLVKTQVEAKFNPDGSYAGTQEQLWFQPFETDAKGNPLYENGQLVPKGDPFVPAGWTLQDIADLEMKATGITYQSNKLKDTKF